MFGAAYWIRTSARRPLFKGIEPHAITPYATMFGGKCWIRTNALLRPDLQSGAIDHSANFPYSNLVQ